MGAEADAAGGEFRIQPVDRVREIRPCNSELQIAKTQAQQLLVGEQLPGMCSLLQAGRSRLPVSGWGTAKV
jgi:hypothetical protein